MTLGNRKEPPPQQQESRQCQDDDVTAVQHVETPDSARPDSRSRIVFVGWGDWFAPSLCVTGSGPWRRIDQPTGLALGKIGGAPQHQFPNGLRFLGIGA